MAESGPNRPLIRANTGVQDALLHNPKQSPFSYQAPMTVCNHIVEELSFRPLNFSQRFGSVQTFELSKVADLLGPVQLVIRLAPLVSPPDPGAAALFGASKVLYINNLGMGMFEGVQIQYGSQTICNCLPEWWYIRYRKYSNLPSYTAWRVLSKMDLTQTEQETFAAQGGEVTVNMCAPWADDTSQYFSMVGMSEKLRIIARFKPLRNVISYELTNPAVAPTSTLYGGQPLDLIQDFYIRAECVHLTGAERDTVVANVKSADGQPKMVEDIQAHIRQLIPVTADGPTGAFTYRLQLNNITAPVRSIFWWLEDPRNSNGQVANTEFGGDYPLYPAPDLNRRWDIYWINSGQLTVVPITTSERSRFYNHVRWFSGIHAGEYINAYSFSVAPETPNASFGSLNFGQMDQPTINIRFPNGLVNAQYPPGDATTANVGAYLNVIADTYNFYHEQGGDFTRTFN
jgi:hypothetical protein